MSLGTREKTEKTRSKGPRELKQVNGRASRESIRRKGKRERHDLNPSSRERHANRKKFSGRNKKKKNTTQPGPLRVNLWAKSPVDESKTQTKGQETLEN